MRNSGGRPGHFLHSDSALGLLLPDSAPDARSLVGLPRRRPPLAAVSGGHHWEEGREIKGPPWWVSTLYLLLCSHQSSIPVSQGRGVRLWKVRPRPGQVSTCQRHHFNLGFRGSQVLAARPPSPLILPCRPWLPLWAVGTRPSPPSPGSQPTLQSLSPLPTSLASPSLAFHQAPSSQCRHFQAEEPVVKGARRWNGTQRPPRGEGPARSPQRLSPGTVISGSREQGEERGGGAGPRPE